MPSYFQTKREALKRWGKCKVRPQDVHPAVMQRRLMINNLTEFPFRTHPNFLEVNLFQLQPEMLTPLEFCQAPPIIIDTHAKFDSMLSHLAKQTQLSFDTESNHDDSFYSLICLIQISSSSRDYIVDVFPLYDRIKADLGPIFYSSKILKIVHDMCDTQLLQRDFEIFCQATVNMQDIYNLYKPQEHPISFSDMIYTLFNIKLQKTGQLADWRVRPIPAPLIDYAVADTHYLLRAWNKVKLELLANNINLCSQLLPQTISGLNRIYKFPKRQSFSTLFDRVRSSKPELLLVDSTTSRLVFLKLCELREQIARDIDRSEKAVLSDGLLYDMLSQPADSLTDFMQRYQRYPFVSSYLSSFYSIVSPPAPPVVPPEDPISDLEDDSTIHVDTYDVASLLPPEPTPPVPIAPSAESPCLPDDLSDISDDELLSMDSDECEIVVEEIEIDPPVHSRLSPCPSSRSIQQHRPSYRGAKVSKHAYRRANRKRNLSLKNEIRTSLGLSPMPFRIPPRLKHLFTH